MNVKLIAQGMACNSVYAGARGRGRYFAPSMNGVNQTEPATFLILPCWTLGIVIIFIATSELSVPYGGCKKSPCTFNQRCYNYLAL
jgi:hypothetical protein